MIGVNLFVFCLDDQTEASTSGYIRLESYTVLLYKPSDRSETYYIPDHNGLYWLLRCVFRTKYWKLNRSDKESLKRTHESNLLIKDITLKTNSIQPLHLYYVSVLDDEDQYNIHYNEDLTTRTASSPDTNT